MTSAKSEADGEKNIQAAVGLSQDGLERLRP